MRHWFQARSSDATPSKQKKYSYCTPLFNRICKVNCKIIKQFISGMKTVRKFVKWANDKIISF